MKLGHAPGAATPDAASRGGASLPGATLLVAVMLFAAASPLGALPPDLAIMAHAPVSAEALLGHVSSKNPGLDEIYVRSLYRYYEEECAAEGVSLLVALAQMVHETDYLLFTGAVTPIQYNYAGLGSTSPQVPGLRFQSMRTGVRAHVQHLKAYASTEPLTRELADPRFRYVARGSAPTVLALAGRWAADAAYGEKVLAHALALTTGTAAGGQATAPAAAIPAAPVAGPASAPAALP